MKNTAPIGLGICVVAGLFGFVGGAVSYVMYDWSFLGALLLAAIIAFIVAIILMLGWREPASAPMGAGTAGVGAGTAPTAQTGSAAASGGAASGHAASGDASARADASSAADAGTGATAGAGTGAGATAGAGASTAAASASSPKVKPTASLPGEDDLASRKGDWKYDGEGDDAPKADASAPAVSDQDHDGDGVIEGTDEGSKPELLTAAREGGADNLKEIKGVGPKMEGMLNDMGVYHFDQVASWSADEVAWVDANLKGFNGRVKRDGWVDQAKILAAGGDTEFSKKVEKGGVY